MDVARLSVYGVAFVERDLGAALGGWSLVIAATVAAFLGSFAGSRLLPSISMRGVRWVVALMLFALGVALGTGLV